MANPQVLFLEQDLFSFGNSRQRLVLNLPDIHEKKGTQGKLVTNNFTFECNNINGEFNIGSTSSFLSGQNWEYQPIQVIDEDNLIIWDGIVTNIRRNERERKAYIESKSKTYKYTKNPIDYESSDWETPGDAFKNLCDQESFTSYNNTLLQRSITKYTNEECYIKCNFNRSDGLTLFQAWEKISIYGCADIYSKTDYILGANEICFDHWQLYYGGSSTSFVQNDLKSLPIINTLDSDIINQYNIGYDGDTEITDSAGLGAASRSKEWGEQLAPEMRSNSTENQIVFKDQTSAKYIGESYIRKTHYNLEIAPRALYKIQFDLNYELRKVISLGDYFAFTYSRESWTNKIFQIMEINRNRESRNINVVAHEVQT